MNLSKKVRRRCHNKRAVIKMREEKNDLSSARVTGRNVGFFQDVERATGLDEEKDGAVVS